MTSQLIDIYINRQEPFPKQKDIAGRALEEMVELCLAAGSTPSEILLHVSDAISNEARKKGCYPSEMLGNGPDKDEIATEIADIHLWVGLLQDLTGLSNNDIQTKEDAKFDKLYYGRLYFNDKSLFYGQKGTE